MRVSAHWYNETDRYTQTHTHRERERERKRERERNRRAYLYPRRLLRSVRNTTPASIAFHKSSSGEYSASSAEDSIQAHHLRQYLCDSPSPLLLTPPHADTRTHARTHLRLLSPSHTRTRSTNPSHASIQLSYSHCLHHSLKIQQEREMTYSKSSKRGK